VGNNNGEQLAINVDPFANDAQSLTFHVEPLINSVEHLSHKGDTLTNNVELMKNHNELLTNAVEPLTNNAMPSSDLTLNMPITSQSNRNANFEGILPNNEETTIHSSEGIGGKMVVSGKIEKMTNKGSVVMTEHTLIKDTNIADAKGGSNDEKAHKRQVKNATFVPKCSEVSDPLIQCAMDVPIFPENPFETAGLGAEYIKDGIGQESQSAVLPQITPLSTATPFISIESEPLVQPKRKQKSKKGIKSVKTNDENKVADQSVRQVKNATFVPKCSEVTDLSIQCALDLPLHLDENKVNDQSVRQVKNAKFVPKCSEVTDPSIQCALDIPLHLDLPTVSERKDDIGDNNATKQSVTADERFGQVKNATYVPKCSEVDNPFVQCAMDTVSQGGFATEYADGETTTRSQEASTLDPSNSPPDNGLQTQPEFAIEDIMNAPIGVQTVDVSADVTTTTAPSTLDQTWVYSATKQNSETTQTTETTQQTEPSTQAAASAMSANKQQHTTTPIGPLRSVEERITEAMNAMVAESNAVQSCPPLACTSACVYGRRKDSNGCETCRCKCK